VYNDQESQLELRASAGRRAHLQAKPAQTPGGFVNIGLIAQVGKPYLTNDGHSSTLWLIDVEQRAAHLHSVYEDGRVVLARDADHPNARQPRYWSTDDP
jgi:hypothetical protein